MEIPLKTAAQPQILDTARKTERMSQTLKIQTILLKAAHDFLVDRGLMQVLPIMLSTITDPLSHIVDESKVFYQGQCLELTKSMIFHKQIALAETDVKGIFIFSPNVRLEASELGSSGRHLFEFSQLDIEIRDYTAPQFMDFMEDLIIQIFTEINAKCKESLAFFDRELLIPRKPFPLYSSTSLKKQLGADFEQEQSNREEHPFWITNFKREFYDKENPELQGTYINYDLMFPEGFNEALSGGEREFEYSQLLKRISEDGLDLTKFHSYLEYAKRRKIGPSAGGGLGLERLLRYVVKASHIGEVGLFPRVPGKKVKL